MDVHAELRRPAHEAALRAVRKPPAKPWRGGSGASAAPPAPPPPKVYRVEPRDFRDLVQKLTGAPPTATATGRGGMQPQQPVAVRAGGEEQLYNSPWFSFPLAGVDAHHGGSGGLM